MGDGWRNALISLAQGLWLVFLILTTTLLMLYLPQRCAAQGVPELPDLVLEPCVEAESLRLLALEDGTQGMWFARPTAQCLLGRLDQLSEIVPYVRLLEERLRLTDDRDALQLRRVILAEEQALTAADALETSVRRRVAAEEALEAWYRAPLLWLAIGVVVTVVLEVAAVWAISAVAP